MSISARRSPQRPCGRPRRKRAIVEAGRVVGIYSDPHDGLRIGLGLRYHIVNIVIACRPIGGALRPSDETPDVGWFDLDDLPSCVPSHYRRIADARAGGETVLG